MTSHTPNATPDGATVPPAPTEDRGRKLLLRITLGLLLAGGTLALLAWDHAGGRQAGLTLLLALAAGAALHEFYGILCAKGQKPAAGLAVFLGVFALLMRASNGGRIFGDLGLGVIDDVLAPLFTFLGPVDLFLVGLLLLLAGLVLGRKRTVEDVIGTVFGIVYVWLPLCLFLDLRALYVAPNRPAGEAAIFVLLVSNKVSDSAAYLCGTFFGRHKMAPAISPKKTWEGAAGGLLFGTAAGALVVWLLMPGETRMAWGQVVPGWGTAPEWTGAVVFSALLVAAGQLGDLVESAIKRWGGVKDSGRLVPEFGGALDMIDGFLVSAPVAYLFLKCGGLEWVF